MSFSYARNAALTSNVINKACTVERIEDIACVVGRAGGLSRRKGDMSTIIYYAG